MNGIHYHNCFVVDRALIDIRWWRSKPLRSSSSFKLLLSQSFFRFIINTEGTCHLTFENSLVIIFLLVVFWVKDFIQQIFPRTKQLIDSSFFLIIRSFLRCSEGVMCIPSTLLPVLLILRNEFTSIVYWVNILLLHIIKLFVELILNLLLHIRTGRVIQLCFF